MLLSIPQPNPRQAEFLRDTHRHVAFGGARGGGKSWAVRVKAVLLALGCPGIRILIVRKTYKELMNNHVIYLQALLHGVAQYHRTDQLFRFPGGSTSYSDWARRYVAEQGYAWFDWSGLTGDTHPNMNAQKVLDYALKTCGEREVIILLAHEGKQTTRDALPRIVAHYRELGYEFRMLSTSPEERSILSRCTANMRLPSEKIE